MLPTFGSAGAGIGSYEPGERRFCFGWKKLLHPLGAVIYS